MASLVLTIRETLRYRGAIGQWTWVLHRLTGLGVVFFLVLHVIDTSWAVFYPELYEKAIKIYQSPLFTIGEFGLVFAVVYHALNGLRIGIMDNKPELWKYQERASYIVLGATALILVPLFLSMGLHVADHYREYTGEVMSPIEAALDQLPFLAGMGVAIIAAVILSWVYGMVVGAETPQGSAKAQGSALERFWWSFMRVSGLLIVPLVMGHLVMIHVLQGVFDLTAKDAVVVGTNLINQSGTATEFVMHRWNYLLGGVAVWKLYDIALLALVTVHGFNGLRYVLTDYTQDSPTLRRAMGYLTVIGAVTLLVVGGAALLGTIEPSTIELLKNSAAAIK